MCMIGLFFNLGSIILEIYSRFVKDFYHFKEIHIAIFGKSDSTRVSKDLN